MAVSESGQIINELRASGLSMESIGQAIGRNRSLVRQVSIGAKPGNNLRDALAELRERLATVAPDARRTVARSAPVTPPAARTTKTGKTARVRGKTTIGGRAWKTGTVRQQASRSGARALGKLAAEAAEAGMALAVTVQFDKAVTVQGYSKGKRGKAGAGGALDFQIDPDGYDSAEGSFTAWLCSQALAGGYISGQGNDAGAYVGHVVSIEARAF